MAPERMLYWCVASTPVICCHGKEIVGNGTLRLGGAWIALREPCHLLGIAGLVWQVPWCSTPSKLAADHQMDVTPRLDAVALGSDHLRRAQTTLPRRW